MPDKLLILAFAAQVLRITVPYLLPSIGAAFSERAGIVNIALEGMLLIGAFFATVAVYMTGSPAAGIVFGMIGGALIALLHALGSVLFAVDQIVTGVALNLFALGVTKFSCQLIFHSSSNSSRIPGLEAFSGSGIAAYPILHEVANGFFIFIVLILIISHVLLFRTKYGLRLRAVGEDPHAAASLGLRVRGLRMSGLLISGVLAGLGGAWLALDQHSFTDGMSAGRGFIALAALIIGKWRPMYVALACLFFGFAETLAIRLQGDLLPVQFIQLIPYVLTMIVLAGFIGKSTPPAADGVPYDPENDVQ